MVSERCLAKSTYHFDTETNIHDFSLSGTED